MITALSPAARATADGPMAFAVRDADLATQMLLIDFEAYAIAGALLSAPAARSPRTPAD